MSAPVAVAGDTSLADTRALAPERLAQPLTMAQLTRHVGMFERSMRRFVEETCTMPLQWLRTCT
ncbi:hypothetical protein [Streptomyces sp. NPDC086519]|uniref:hypothetical protein n=1 Tax=Streptomyces sp. NPDC086519 TaxID=3154863 RepID=UPI0034258D65